MHLVYILLFFSTFCGAATFANEALVWKGSVSSDGNASASIPLEIGATYQISVSGTINLGKWRQNGQPLGEDAYFSFEISNPSDLTGVSKSDNFKNSMLIAVGGEKYNPSHVYVSQPFKATENRIHFWVYDTNYDDNSGAFSVQIFKLKPAEK